MKVGVLGLQGDVREHLRALEAAGSSAVVVKTSEELADVDALVLPGGESTTIGKLMERFGLLAAVRERVFQGMPVYGTCAGMILMARKASGDQVAAHSLDVMDITVRRNAYGRQIDSFEAELDVAGMDSPFGAVFIRAPVVEAIGPRVDVLARWDGAPVLVREGRLLASSFHPELTGDRRIHELFVRLSESV